MSHFGMPALIEAKTLLGCASLCNELSLDFIELNMNLPQFQVENMDIDAFRSVSEKYGIYYTIHLDENMNIGDFNRKVANAYRQTAFETIELAKALNIPVLNMHLSKGVYFTMPDGKIYLYNEYKEQYLQSIKDFRDECEKRIGNANIRICIENCDGYTDFHIDALDLLLSSSVFGVTFDIGHNHAIGGSDEAIILKYLDKLYHMHIHDGFERKNHLALGTGEIDLAKYFALAEKQHSRVVLETKTIRGLKQSVKWVRNNL